MFYNSTNKKDISIYEMSFFVITNALIISNLSGDEGLALLITSLPVKGTETEPLSRLASFCDLKG